MQGSRVRLILRPHHLRPSMSAPASDSVTRLLIEAADGDRAKLGDLFDLVYGELLGLAGRHLRNERSDHTLSSTALVHEAYIKLVDQSRVEWQSRAHFYAVASQAMRRILVSYARKRNAQKRGGGEHVVTLHETYMQNALGPTDLIALDEALDRLAKLSERQCRVVECRFFVGLSVEETAEALDISPATVKRDWRIARAWLYRELAPQGADEEE